MMLLVFPFTLQLKLGNNVQQLSVYHLFMEHLLGVKLPEAANGHMRNSPLALAYATCGEEEEGD